MKRSVSMAVFIIWMCMSVLQPVMAADALHRMLNGEQDLLVLGQLTTREEGWFEMRVIRAFQGRASGTTIRVSDDFVYHGFTEVSGQPVEGDYAVLSLNLKDGLYEPAWYMARATSGHRRELQLYYDPEAGIGLGDLEALQYYVNTNGRHTEFYFTGDRVFARRSLLEDVDLTGSLRPHEPETVSPTGTGEERDAKESAVEESGGLTLGVVLSAIMLAFFVLVIYIRLRVVFMTVRRQKKTAK